MSLSVQIAHTSFSRPWWSPNPEWKGGAAVGRKYGREIEEVGGRPGKTGTLGCRLRTTRTWSENKETLSNLFQTLRICSRSVKLVCFYGFVHFSGNVLYAGHLVSQVIILIIITVIITRSYWKLLQLLLILTISQPIKTMILSYSEILWVSHSHGIVGIDFLCSMVFEVSARKTWLPGTQINWRCLHAHTGQPMLAIGWDLNWILDQAPPYGLSICLGFLRVIKLLPR